MAPLKVIVPKGISGYARFGIQVNRSQKMRWDWDCRKDDGDATYQLVIRDITLGAARDDRRIRFTYLVMSNPVEATVEIETWLPDSTAGVTSYTACGTISACISGLEHPVVLFTSEKPIKIPFQKKKKLILPLARSAVKVPQGEQLQIDMRELHIWATDGSSNQEQEVGQFRNGNGRLSFDIEDSRPKVISIDGGRGELEVIVDWKGKQYEVVRRRPICFSLSSSPKSKTHVI